MLIENDASSMQNAEWRIVIGSEGQFEVSNVGQVRKVATGRLMKLSINDRGYLCCGVTSSGNRKVRKVHIMVAEAFIGQRPDGQEVAFKDGTKANCNLFNLEYGTPKGHAENRIRNGFVPPSAKLTADMVLEMRRLINAKVNFAVIASQYGVSYGAVKKISQRLTWSHI
jgi:hypothetical protein